MNLNQKIASVMLFRSDPFPKHSELKKQLAKEGFYPLKYPQFFVDRNLNFFDYHNKLITKSADLKFYASDPHESRKVVIENRSEIPAFDLNMQDADEFKRQYRAAKRTILERSSASFLIKSGIAISALANAGRFFYYPEAPGIATIGILGIGVAAFLLGWGRWMYYRISLWIEKREVLKHIADREKFYQ